jgi:23S rRNA (guanosine2251-2'-O)-methyltransferase
MTRPGRKRREAAAAPARAPRREESRRPDSRREAKPAGDAVAGKNSVVETLRAKIPAKELLIAERTEVDEKIAESLRLAKNQNLAVKEVPRATIDGVTGTTTHQGIALVIKPFHYTDFDQMLANSKEEDGPGLIIGMDGVTDPHNLGAIVRSAAAFGADGVVIPERRNASMTGSAWKASAGAAARMPISQVTNLVRSIEDAKKAGYFVVGLAADGDEELPNFSLAEESVYVIVGSEGKGLSRLARQKCDLVLSIPMNSEVESLNASVATAIVMHWIAAKRAK